MQKLFLYISLFGLFLIPNLQFAQEELQDVALDTSAFENSYFESLKQKGIENYDKAITALEKCLELQPNNAVVYFELGKNYLNQKNYNQAFDNFEKATKIDPTNRWFWVGMYDVCYETRDFNKAIQIVQKLIEFKSEYKEDLTSLYMSTQQFDKALSLINELNDQVGKSEKRDNYKMQIMQDSRFSGVEKANLLDQIKKNPKVEANYINLIYLYSKSNEEEKANEIAIKLEKEVPNSDFAQVSLFKFHINNNDGDKAVVSMNKVLASEVIDRKIKHRVFNEFLIFTQSNAKYDTALEKAIGYFENDKEVQVAKEIGKFYQNKKEFVKASKYYQMHLNSNPNDMETLLLLMQSYVDATDFKNLQIFTEEQMQLFPTQPEIYYYGGLANNQLQNFKKSKAILESGIDFIIDNPTLEINFTIQLGEAYNGLGDFKKKEIYFTKANDLIQKQKSK
jgi:tetratricopeptide (TPR) repeat protein